MITDTLASWKRSHRATLPQLLLQTIRRWEPGFAVEPTPTPKLEPELAATLDFHEWIVSALHSLPLILVSRAITRAWNQQHYPDVIRLFQFALRKDPIFLRLEERERILDRYEFHSPSILDRMALMSRQQWGEMEQALGQPFVDFIRAYPPDRLVDGVEFLAGVIVSAISRDDFTPHLKLCSAVWQMLTGVAGFEEYAAQHLVNRIYLHQQPADRWVGLARTCMQMLRNLSGGEQETWSRMSRTMGNYFVRHPWDASVLHWWLNESGHPTWNNEDWLGLPSNKSSPLTTAKAFCGQSHPITQMVQAVYDRWHAKDLPVLSIACGLDSYLLPELASIVWQYAADLAPTSRQLQRLLQEL